MLDTPTHTGADRNVIRRVSSWPSKARDKMASDVFLRGAGWLGAAQVLGRVFRLLTTLVVARIMTPEYFGLAAIALASNELAHVIARFGTSAYIVQASDEQLKTDKHVANALNWAIGISLFVLQCLAAFPIAAWYDAPGVFGPICVLALAYLMMPLGELHAALNQRNNHLDALARGDIYQAIGDSFLTIILALAGFGVWALILPKVIVVPLWIIPQRLKVTYVARWPRSWTSASGIFRFSRQVLGVELLTIFRTNIDVLIVGSLLGVNALGIYFFAMNAGLGIIRSLLSALSRALYSYLCGSTDNKSVQQRFQKGLLLTFMVVVPWVALQAGLAHWYVPVIFGDKWVDYGAVPILMIFCLSGIPLAFSESASQYLRATGRTQADLRWYMPFTVLYTGALFIGVKWGLMGAAVSVLLVYLINAPLYYWFNIRRHSMKSEEASTFTSTTALAAAQQ